MLKNLVIFTLMATMAFSQGTTCSGRGGCTCDCSWANNQTCGKDDGSCCFLCCCSTPPGPSPPGPSGNPVLNKTFYVNPSYQAELDSSIATCDPRGGCSASTKATMQGMRNVSSAYWLDVYAKISCGNTSCADGILEDAKRKGNQLVTLIVYDLPNRDCHAKASNGEICCTYNADRTCDYDAGGDCSDGIQEYKTKYVDPLVALFARYPTVPIVAIVEPDSLPNLATNQADPHCGNSATTAAYKVGIPYTVAALSKLPNVAVYVDGAHGGWLGWQDNMVVFASLVKELNIPSFGIRGFATNVANYQPLGVACPSADWCMPNAGHLNDACCADPCKLEGQYNPCNNEHNYVEEMTKALGTIGMKPQYVIDTGRSGVAGMRQMCANWCNIRGAGIGPRPTTDTASPLIDAYAWLKTPGESDGCTSQLPDGSQCARFDSFCGSEDSIGSASGEPRVPLAGKWFDFGIKMLASNSV